MLKTLFKTTDRHTILLILSHTLIGIGLFYINVFHTSTVFENKYNFSHLSKMEREMIFTSEHGLYFSYYKTIVEERSFADGYNRLLNDNLTEYPSTINSISRFDIMPEIVIGYLFKKFKNITSEMGIKTISCWAVDRGHAEPIVSCEGLGEPIYFYLSFIWYISGLTVFLLYMFGTYLNRNFFGGIATVIYFFIIHNDATRAHITPAARENFALPVILWQFFYLTISIERMGYSDMFTKSRVAQFLQRNYVMIFKQTVLTTVSLLLWQFSSVIFATQIVILFLMLQFSLLKIDFVVDYAISQISANVITYFVKYQNIYYLISIHNALAISLILHRATLLIDRINSKDTADNSSNNTGEAKKKSMESEGGKENIGWFKKMRNITHDIVLFVSMTVCILNLIERTNHITQNYNFNKNTHYFDLVLTNLRLKMPTFNSILYLSDSQFSYIDMATVKSYNNVFFIKFISLFIVIFLGRILYIYRKGSNSDRKSAVSSKQDDVERIKNYLLEDFLEENHIKLNDLSNYEIEYNKELEILKTKYNYDYELYKAEKSRNSEEGDEEKINFLNDIKKLKEQISKNDKRSKINSAGGNEKEKLPQIGSKKEKSSTKKTAKPKKSEETPATETATDSSPSVITPPPLTIPSVLPLTPIFIIRPHYLYNLIQLLFLFLMTGLALKIKYMLTPLLCLISSTFPPKNWFVQKNTSVYWTVLAVLLMFGIMDPGIANIKNQYRHDEFNNIKFEELLKWIEINTDQNAVFAGPVDVTPSILLVNRRAIVNHPHHELPEMEERTKLVYSIFSKKHSSDVYNNLAKLKVQYVVLPYKDCFLPTSVGWVMSEIWDFIDPDNKKNTQFCAELFQKPNSNFLVVFSNEKYLVIKIFSQSVELELKKLNIIEFKM